ncbi:MAG: hypothetical protein V4651_06315 [Bacteroidota bacterium]
MSDLTHKQEVVTLLVNIPRSGSKIILKQYPELNPFFDMGMYIETFSQCRLSKKQYSITFILRHYNSV